MKRANHFDSDLLPSIVFDTKIQEKILSEPIYRDVIAAIGIMKYFGNT